MIILNLRKNKSISVNHYRNDSVVSSEIQDIEMAHGGLEISGNNFNLKYKNLLM